MVRRGHLLMVCMIVWSTVVVCALVAVAVAWIDDSEVMNGKELRREWITELAK